MDKKIIFLILIVSASFLFHFYFQAPYFNYNDAAIYAGVAKNIKEGQGLSTNFIYPEYFRYIGQLTQNKWYSYWPPLHSLFLAIGFFLFGTSDRAVMYVTGLFFLLSVWLVYLLARKIFNKEVAIFSCLFYSLTQEMLWYSTSGLSEPLFICLLLLCLFFLYDTKKKITIFCAGLSLGLAVMTRNTALIYIPALVFFIYFSQTKGRRAKSIFSFLAGISLVIFSFHKMIVPLLGGYCSFKDMFWSPFFFNTEVYPGGQIMRALDKIDFSFTVKNLAFIFKKIFPNLKIFFRNLSYFNAQFNTWNWIYTLMPPFLGIFYILSLFKPPSQKNQRLIHVAVIFLFLTVLVVSLLTITKPEMKYFHPLVPFLIIFAVSGLIRVFNRLALDPYRRRVYLNFLVAVLIAIFLLPQTAKNYFYNREKYKNNPKGVYQIMGDVVREYTKPHDVVVTNLDAWGSWYGERKTVYYPSKPTNLSKLSDYAKIDALLIFENLFVDEPGWLNWLDLITNPKDFDDFKFIKIIKVPLNKKETIKVALYRKK
ncbi:MAG: glycosyltransferase family 39 protein [Candidatus Omnitrophica bacterium]|nr:glycosyltransferase family 39 protein [Candidatus Omnitrophota bacterium]MBU1133607.1 glycosyltransferase family 39 protein [Candidatus Omnitrophota bacterium]MBU1367107.1 glycosyltransferase family 39 protein [Candidatus Omnitrophota bacterium]MBU1524384.1 glycosyltransferase family 39 protein [Candidatus Omnitrophota bacterium]MBU1810382.1 glycosyltransferase family 39 protein [Candidatus Omnitrophota bacterium]